MTYELAKQLKDAGFPYDWCSEDDCSCLLNGIDSECFPALSNLIQACGDGFISISKTMNLVMWFCNKNPLNDDGYEKDVYDTPEEAVADLWLELNKK